MILGGSTLYDLSINDFKALVDNRVQEGPHLDYKENAYSGRPQDIREMLRDIIALANAEGGYLVLGVKEDNAGRANCFSPIDNPLSKIQAIRQACLDGIQDRIQGLEVEAFETGAAQGIIVIRVPHSANRPHMVIRDHRTDFYQRYGTDKRTMTVNEIRGAVLSTPLFRRMVELELQLEGQRTVGGTGIKREYPPYAQLITNKPVERFLQQYLLGAFKYQSLIIVSPFIGDLVGEVYELEDVLNRVLTDKTRVYVVTRPPREDYHRAGIQVLEQSPRVEIRYNPDIHAKLYICWSREEEGSFALFGSGNLTTSGLRYNLELGIIIFSKGHGKMLVRSLYQWGAYTLRSMSERVKAINI